MRIGSLFTGYGGLDIAAERYFSATTAWTCDIDAGASKIIAHHWPDIPNLHDITTVNWADVEPVDILAGGWPCQPFSLAGKQKGAADERALWPYVAETVRALRPQYIVLENVAAITTAGELGRALSDLAALRYVGQWRCLRAADIGAPHGRARIFILATNTQSIPRRQSCTLGVSQRPRARTEPRECSSHNHTRSTIRGPLDWGPYSAAIQRWERIIGRSAPAPTQPSHRGHLISPNFVEWMMGLAEGWVTKVPGLDEEAQLKALGNGVVPQQALAALTMMEPICVR